MVNHYPGYYAYIAPPNPFCTTSFGHSSSTSFPNPTTSASPATFPPPSTNLFGVSRPSSYPSILHPPVSFSSTDSVHPSFSSRNTVPCLPEVQALFDFLPDSLSTKTHSCVNHAWKVTQGDSVKAVEYLEDWAHVQVTPPLPLPPIPRTFHMLKGMENAGNTCYIDSLIFALFVTLDWLDTYLTQLPPPPPPPPPRPRPTSLSTSTAISRWMSSPLLHFSTPTSDSMALPTTTPFSSPETQDEKYQRYMYHVRPVQIQLALIVTRLRKGYCVTAMEMQHLETSVHYLWTSIGKRNSQVGNQEDVTELFFLLADVLGLPTLPMYWCTEPNSQHSTSSFFPSMSSYRAYEKMKTSSTSLPYLERCLQLSVPMHHDVRNVPEPRYSQRKPSCLSLIHLIEQYFKDHPPPPPPPPSSPTFSNSIQLNTPSMLLPQHTHSSTIPTTTTTSSTLPLNRSSYFPTLHWIPPPPPSLSFLHLSSSLPSSRPWVPMLLKRYTVNHQGQLQRLNTPVHIPYTLPIPMSRLPSSFSTPPLPSPTSFVSTFSPHLVLRSVICHVGTQMESGHYVTYTQLPTSTSSSSTSTSTSSFPSSLASSSSSLWVKYDGLARPRCVTAPLSQWQEHIDQTAYLVFYELAWSVSEEERSNEDHGKNPPKMEGPPPRMDKVDGSGKGMRKGKENGSGSGREDFKGGTPSSPMPSRCCLM
ncbi:hypothetical protein HMI56_001298 [Coelomomyces lativittatus]|nr:hypothetical protein HMI56_001298 [Coelomomyces lativittatus]